jgi:hypothetical protein
MPKVKRKEVNKENFNQDNNNQEKDTISKKQQLKNVGHSPAPHPERAIYGFFLLITAIFSFIIYSIISYVPDSILNEFGWDYLPNKYWSVGLPTFIILGILMIIPFYFTLNIIQVNDHDSINCITDEHALDRATQTKSNRYSQYSIDPIYDLRLSDVNKFLFLE